MRSFFPLLAALQLQFWLAGSATHLNLPPSGKARSLLSTTTPRKWNLRLEAPTPNRRLFLRGGKWRSGIGWSLRGGGEVTIEEQEVDPGLSPKLKEQLASSLECTMCLNLLCQPVTLRCGHSYCSCCITSWMRTGNNICPLCRSPGQSKKRREHVIVAACDCRTCCALSLPALNHINR